MFSYTGIKHNNLKSTGKKFHLVDAFGFDESSNTKNSLEIASEKYRPDIFDLVKKKFDRLPVIFHRGYVPEILHEQKGKLPEKICFLSMDLNNYLAEKAGIEFLWDRIVPGGFVYIDDFACQGYEKTRSFYEEFFESKGAFILKTPYSPALVIKP